MNKKTIGTFYGVGVGPGDPELLTLKALKVLRSSGVIAVPVSDRRGDNSGLALSVVKKAIDLDGKELLTLPLPMTRDKEALKAARAEVSIKIVERLKKGSDVSFITLGDPMLYSTFSYLLPFVREILPEAEIKVVPGVSSISASASAALIPVAESDEKVLIIPAAYDIEELRRAIKGFDTVVVMKVTSVMDKLLELLDETGLESKAVFVSKAGWEEEEVIRDLREMRGRRPDYFSMVIVKR